MSRALVTLATGPHEELLEIALPSFDEFASRHGYTVIVAEVDSDRPPSWHKIPAVRETLVEYGEALWVDADIVIVDPSDDLPVPADAWQAMVPHHTADGEVPNMGVWFVRRPMLPVLDRIWKMVEYRDHGWWEQAAMVDLLGYRGWPLQKTEPSNPAELDRRTHFLEAGWNVHRNDLVKTGRPRFMHATMYEDRAAVMREWADRALAVAA